MDHTGSCRHNVLISLSTSRVLKSELSDNNLVALHPTWTQQTATGHHEATREVTYRELVMRLLDISLEIPEAVPVPMQVNIVEVTSTRAGVYHLLKPVETLAGHRAGGNGGESFLDGQGVDVLFVPSCCVAWANVGRTAVGFVQTEDGCMKRRDS